MEATRLLESRQAYTDVERELESVLRELKHEERKRELLAGVGVAAAGAVGAGVAQHPSMEQQHPRPPLVVGGGPAPIDGTAAPLVVGGGGEQWRVPRPPLVVGGGGATAALGAAVAPAGWRVPRPPLEAVGGMEAEWRVPRPPLNMGGGGATAALGAAAAEWRVPRPPLVDHSVSGGGRTGDMSSVNPTTEVASSVHSTDIPESFPESTRSDGDPNNVITNFLALKKTGVLSTATTSTVLSTRATSLEEGGKVLKDEQTVPSHKDDLVESSLVVDVLPLSEEQIQEQEMRLFDEIVGGVRVAPDEKPVDGDAPPAPAAGLFDDAAATAAEFLEMDEADAGAAPSNGEEVNVTGEQGKISSEEQLLWDEQASSSSAEKVLREDPPAGEEDPPPGEMERGSSSPAGGTERDSGVPAVELLTTTQEGDGFSGEDGEKSDDAERGGGHASSDDHFSSPESLASLSEDLSSSSEGEASEASDEDFFDVEELLLAQEYEAAGMGGELLLAQESQKRGSKASAEEEDPSPAEPSTKLVPPESDPHHDDTKPITTML